jgi:hypothetical protein
MNSDFAIGESEERSDDRDRNPGRVIEWVVGEFDDRLLVLPVEEAERLAVLHDALKNASSWGELLREIGTDDHLLTEVRAQYGDELPDAAESFERDQIRGCIEGDWPPIPAELMASWLPDSIADLGTSGRTLFAEDLMRVAPGHRGEVLMRLQQLGLRCREDDDLVSRASGSWRYG